MSDTATVEIYPGYHDEVPDHEPAYSAALDISEDWWGRSQPKRVPSSADTYTLANDIRYESGPMSIWCETPRPVFVCVHTNDAYHDPDAWGKPIEGGLLFEPGIERRPFGCEVWGRVIIWVGAAGEQ